MRSLKAKLAFFFAVLLFLPITVFALIINDGMNRSFDAFADKQQQQLLQQIRSQVMELYIPDHGHFSEEGLAAIGNAALQNGVILHLQAANGELDWDISTHRTQECQLMLQHREQNLHSRYPSLSGGYQQMVYELSYGEEQIGTLTLGYFGPYSLNDIEVKFITEMNRQLMLTAIIFLIVVILAGLALGIGIARPVRHVSMAVQQISAGDYGVQLSEKFSSTEIQQLIESVNKMSQTLKSKDIQKRRLTADVAHELRTPLSNLQAHMEAVIDGVWEPSQDFYESCHSEILRLNNIVSQLQSLTSYEEKRVALDKKPFSVMEFYTKLQSLFDLPAREKGVTLHIDCIDDAICIADQMRMQQCIGNLLSNAIRYTPPGGTVTLRYNSFSTYHCLSVVDTGIGIPAEDLPNIFERFYRVDQSRSTNTGGQGIGLTIAKAIAEAHGGEIKVSSILGKGTVFEVFLPQKE